MLVDLPDTDTKRMPSEPLTTGRPRVSVVIPLYNKARSISATLASVLGQTVADFEVVVVDDGSTDGSADIVSRFRDSRLRLIEQANAGGSAARNRGIAEAHSDLIAFIDADDLWFPHFLQTVLALHDRFPQAGACSTAFVGRQNGVVIRFPYVGVRCLLEGELISDYFRSCTLGGSLLSSSSVMIPRSVFEHLGAFPVGVRTGEDLHMWARIALHYPIAWSTIEAAVWNQDAENRIAGRIVMEDAPFADVLNEAIAEKQIAPARAKWIKAYLSRFRVHYAQVSLEHGERSKARRLLWLGRESTGQRREWTITVIRTLLPRPLLKLRRALLTQAARMRERRDSRA